MKKIIFYSLFIYGLLFTSSLHSQNVQKELEKQLDYLLRYQVHVNFDKTPGILVSIIDNGKVWTMARGQELDSDRPLSSSDVFQLGGNSQIITAEIIQDLISSNMLDWHTKLETIFPSYDLSKEVGDITIHELLHHKSGVPLFILGIDNLTDSQNISGLETIKILSNQTLDSKAFEYTQHNYTILKEVIYKITNLPYFLFFKYWTKNLLNRTIEYESSPVAGLDKNGFYHSGQQGDYHDHIISMDDMNALLMQVIIPGLQERDASADQQIEKTNINRRTYIMEGWYGIKLSKNRYLYTHAGSTNRHHTSIQVMPDTGTAVVVFTNSELGADKIGLDLMKFINQNWRRKSIYGKEKK